MENNGSDVWIVESPSELVAITGNETRLPPKQLRLRLLRPLQSEETLTACREHATTRPKYPPAGQNGVGTNESRVEEVLDLEPLFKAWRSAWSSIPVGDKRLPNFVFDIDLPTTVQWGRSQASGMRVVEERLSRFLQGFATVMSVRSKYRATFDLVGTQSEYFGAVVGVLDKLNNVQGRGGGKE